MLIINIMMSSFYLFIRTYEFKLLHEIFYEVIVIKELKIMT